MHLHTMLPYFKHSTAFIFGTLTMNKRVKTCRVNIVKNHHFVTKCETTYNTSHLKGLQFQQFSVIKWFINVSSFPLFLQFLQRNHNTIHKFVTHTMSVSWQNRRCGQSLVACSRVKKQQQNNMYWFASASLANPYCQSTWMSVCMYVCLFVRVFEVKYLGNERR